MRTLLGLFTFALVACPGAAPTASTPPVVVDAAVPEVVTAAPVAETAEPEPFREINSLPASGLIELPKSFALDGDVGEWEDSAEVKFVLTTDGLTIAGKLPKETPQEDTITVLFQFGSRQLPTIGAPLRGGGVFELNCESTWDGQPLDEPEAMHCQGMMAAATQFRDAWEADGQRTWRLGPKGVTTPQGASVEGATSIVKKGAEVTFEAKIPLAALPLAIEAPVTAASVFVTTELKDPNPRERNAVAVLFGDGVRFGSSTELRRRALEEWGLGLIDGVPAVAYRLGDDASWILGLRAPGWLSYERKVVPVFVKDESFKGFDVGRLYAGTERLVTVKDSNIVGMEGVVSGEILGSVKRAPGLHLFAVDSYRDEVGQTMANWTVYVVDGEGQVSSESVAPAVYAWELVEPFHAKDFRTFGFAGKVANSDAPGPVRVTYSFKPATKSYEPKVTGLE